MHLERQTMDAMFPRELRRLFPVRHHLFLPLPLQHLVILGWPRRGNPVRLSVSRRAPGTTGKTNDHSHSDPFRELYRLLEGFRIARGMLRIRVNRISVTTQRCHANAAVFKFLEPGLRFCRVVINLLERTMTRPGITSGADLHRFEPRSE